MRHDMMQMLFSVLRGIYQMPACVASDKDFFEGSDA
jgi:hypothetical protein